MNERASKQSRKHGAQGGCFRSPEAPRRQLPGGWWHWERGSLGGWWAGPPQPPQPRAQARKKTHNTENTQQRKHATKKCTQQRKHVTKHARTQADRVREGGEEGRVREGGGTHLPSSHALNQARKHAAKARTHACRVWEGGGAHLPRNQQAGSASGVGY